MDVYGYPDDEELEKIKTWNPADPMGLMDYVEERWEYGDVGGFRSWPTKYAGTDKPIMVFALHTFGWSGNESLIEAMMENTVFWMMNWFMTRRGGHYWFKVRN